MPFAADLAFGEKYQRKLLDILAYDECEMKKGYFKPYDVRIVYGGAQSKWEVKADRYAKRTNCLCIEYEYKGQPSGITSTEADFWAYFIDGTNTYYTIPVEAIKQAIADKKYNRTCNGGDGYNSKLYIIPADVFDEFKDTYDE